MRVALLAAALIAAVNVLLFVTPAYRAALDPNSSTGSFEAARRALTVFPANPHTDVLVVGDSRIYSGLDPATATAATGGRLRFLDASVPGTTPRVWYYFLKAIDPDARRFRAIVIPIDADADDDGAIGSIDGNQREQDLHYLAFALVPLQIPKLAMSFSGMRTEFTTAIALLLRGPLLRDDVQALAANPGARLDDVAKSGVDFSPLAWHPRDETLTGLHVDFVRNAIRYPAGISADERSAMTVQVLRRVNPSPSYATYRRDWLYPIVQRYRAAGTPVIFVRIPTRPAHRDRDDPVSGSLLALQKSGLAHILPWQPYLALERPDLFADHDHLNRAGSALFSDRLGRDAARALADPTPAAYGLFRRPGI